MLDSEITIVVYRVRTLACATRGWALGHRHINTVIVAPMTTQGRAYPTQVPCTFQGRQGQVVLDQSRTVDKSRLITKLGRINRQTQRALLAVLHDMFLP